MLKQLQLPPSRERIRTMKPIANLVCLTMGAAAAISLHAQAQPQSTDQQSQILQQLLRMQQGSNKATPATATQPSSLSPEQMQQLIKALSQEQDQNAAASDLMKILQAARTPGAVPTSQGSIKPVTAVLRQGGDPVSLLAHAREVVFFKSKSNDVAEALKAQAMSEAINVGAVAAVKKVGNGIPYLGGMSSVAGGILHRGPAKEQGFEIGFLRGLSSSSVLASAPAEFLVPAGLGRSDAAGFEPLLMKLHAVERDKVRIIDSRKVRLEPQTPNTFGNADPASKEILACQYESVPIEARKNADGSTTVVVTQPLAPGEYALVLQKPEPKSLKLLDTVVDFRVHN
jgi:hypothetical protein